MTEYTEVEQPFLQQLQALGWQIIDQGAQIPSCSAVFKHSHRIIQALLPESMVGGFVMQLLDHNF